MLIVFMLVVMFTLLIVRDEYINFDKEIISVKSKYMEDQKEIISFDINRVMRYVEYKYKNRDKNRSTSDLQKEVLTTIEQLYGRKDGTGYIFIYDFKGKNLSDPLDFDNINRNLYDFKDPNGVYVIRDLINVSKEKDGGFVEYMWVKSASGTPMKKISYAKAFMPWGWMIGTGFYIDEVEAIISVHKAELKARLIKFMMEILSITAVMFTIGLVGLGIINYLISKEINTFKKFFKEAATTHTTIDENEIHINEFKKMVRYINEMVDTIHARKQNLKDINLSLEKRVEQKTKDLIEQNILLEKEKKFNISLIKSQDSFIKHSIHEINTPLAVIMMHIDIRKMKFGEDKYMSKIEAASKMISNIYEDLSYMVKKDRFTYEKQWIFFSKFLEERIDFFEDIAKGNRHNIVYDIDKDIKILFSDIELQRVVDNNLSNAIKYANKDSDIKVRLKRNRRQVILEFETFSKQIENTRKIFEPFHQEEDEHGGFGLGLEIVCSICKKENVLYEVTSAPEVTIFRYTFSNIL
ncbi:two-component sensor histidine kinase [hydrothermal vent metagenome]|uniref:histidine kinase n=1 Tax=hydrothermal vent metagenome TaxID=652676 RepID=A0A1W1EFD6_9ZZZZ